MALRTIDRPGQVFTYTDLEDVPDDGNRYELSYGTLIVTPAPNTRHQAVMVGVAAVLHQHKPSGCGCWPRRSWSSAPTWSSVRMSWWLTSTSSAARASSVRRCWSWRSTRPPTRVLDLTEKRFVYAEAQVPAYWLIDPDAMTLTILELAGGSYVERAVLTGDMELAVNLPFAMTVLAASIFS
ncbi:MAG: Uma2 family endonuclease [Actinomycetota bacterium]|nr:Uma2 family endonuclease [Actinomycetota bacterium]